MVLFGAQDSLQQDRGHTVPNRARTAPVRPVDDNLRLAAIRRLAYEACDCGLLSPDLAAGIRRVKGVRRLKQLTPFAADEIVLCSRFLSAAASGELRLQTYG